MGNYSKKPPKSQREKTPEEIEIDYRRVPLAKGEIKRIIISQTDDGSISTISKAREKPMTIEEAIGLIEVAKVEAIHAVRIKGRDVDPSMAEEVEIVLDEIDVEMDSEGMIAKENLEIGKPIKVSRYASMLRDKRREEYLASKKSKGNLGTS